MLYMALLLGLTGSLHCVGMCGPIALALPVHGGSAARKWTGILLYNSGRVLAYSALGLLVGSLGFLVRIGSWQSVFSVGIGLVLVLSSVFSLAWFEKPAPRFLHGVTGALKRELRRLIGSRRFLSLGVLGILNGFLPCGMVYVALMTAAAGNENSALYMAFYGLGTVPAMMAAGLSGQWISLRIRGYFRKAVPYIVALAGLLLIVRGLESAGNGRHHDHGAAEGIPVCTGK